MIDNQTSLFDLSKMPNAISVTTLAELASAGAIRSVQLVGQRGGYIVMVRYGAAENQLTGQRGEPRLFASLDTAATQLLALGVSVFEVLPANYVHAPKAYRRGRPGAIKQLAKIKRDAKEKASPKKKASPKNNEPRKILPSQRTQLKLPGLPKSIRNSVQQ